MDKEILLLGCGSVGLAILDRLLQEDFGGSLVICDLSEASLSAAKQLVGLRTRRLRDCNIEYRLVNLAIEEDCKDLASVCGGRFDLVIFSAAYKHVDLCEIAPKKAWQNNVGALINSLNVFGNSAASFTFISTDKAVFPTTVMGRTKRMSEHLIGLWAERSSSSAYIVRFGNVLASSGSVVPIFEKQIKAGGPVTVTDRAAKRFVMSLPQAAQLVLEVAESGYEDVGPYLLKPYGEVEILDLAKYMIMGAGYIPVIAKPAAAGEIEIAITGLSKNEKLKEMLTEGGLEETYIAGVFLARERSRFNSGLCFDEASIALRTAFSNPGSTDIESLYESWLSI